MSKTWLDVFISISRQTWLVEMQNTLDFYISNRETCGSLVSDSDDYAMFLFGLHITDETVIAKAINVRNTQNRFNPAIRFEKVIIRPGYSASYSSLSVNMNGYDFFINDMVDYNPVRFEFFKNPIDLINFVSIVDGGK